MHHWQTFVTMDMFVIGFLEALYKVLDLIEIEKEKGGFTLSLCMQLGKILTIFGTTMKSASNFTHIDFT
jgi:hypothetical protein